MDEKPKKRRGGSFKKGQSGNPSGRPKLTLEFKLRIKELSPKALDTLEDVLTNPDYPAPSRVKAAETILAYAEGRPTERVELSGPGGGAMQTETRGEVALTGPTPEMVADVLRVLGRASALPPVEVAAPAEVRDEAADGAASGVPDP